MNSYFILLKIKYLFKTVYKNKYIYMKINKTKINYIKPLEQRNEPVEYDYQV